MSTPSVTILKNLVLNWKSNQMEEETIATFYRHWDGYPSCHAIDIANSLVVASQTKPEQHIDFSGASVERNILNNRNWCQHFLKAMCMVDADIEFIGEDNVPSASYTYVVTGAYDNFGGKDSIGAESTSRSTKEMRTGISCLRAEPLNVWHGLTDIAGIAKSSEGHPGGCPFLWLFGSRPAGGVKARGRCGNGDSGAAFPPFQQPAGRARNPPAIESAEKPSTWRKRGDRPAGVSNIPTGSGSV